jgi:hypothetical protein
MEKALELADRASAMDLRQNRDHIAEQFKRNLGELGLASISTKTVESVKNVLKNTDPKLLALAAAQASGNQHELERLQASYRSANKYVAKGNLAFLQASRDASSLFQGQSKEVQRAIAQIGEHGQGNLEQRIREARHTLYVDVARQAFETTAQRVSEQVGDTHVAGAANVRDLMERLGAVQDLGRIKNKPQRSAVEAWRRASKAHDDKGMEAAENAFTDASLETGAQNRVEIFGGGQSGTAEVDRQIAELEEAKKKFGTDRPEDKAQTLFASSVELFAQAAKDLKAATESMAISNVANPQPREY